MAKSLHLIAKRYHSKIVRCVCHLKRQTSWLSEIGKCLELLSTAPVLIIVLAAKGSCPVIDSGRIDLQFR